MTGNKVYDRKMINDAFKSRFGAAKTLKTQSKNVIKAATAGKDALVNYKKVMAMAPKTEKVVKRDFFGRRLGVEPVKKVKK